MFVGIGVEHPPDLFVGLAVDLIIGQQGVDGPAVVRHLYIGHRPQPDKLALAHLSQMLHSLIQPVRRLRIEHRRQLSRHFQPVINMSQHDSQPLNVGRRICDFAPGYSPRRHKQDIFKEYLESVYPFLRIAGYHETMFSLFLVPLFQLPRGLGHDDSILVGNLLWLSSKLFQHRLWNVLLIWLLEGILLRTHV